MTDSASMQPEPLSDLIREPDWIEMRDAVHEADNGELPFKFIRCGEAGAPDARMQPRINPRYPHASARTSGGQLTPARQRLRDKATRKAA